MGDVEEFKCPSCGGSLTFDATVQTVKCPYCDQAYNIDDLKKNDESNDVLVEEKTEWVDAGGEWGTGETDNLKVYCCESCGGELMTDDNTIATSCPYCGNSVVVKGRVAGTLRPDKVIPFKKTKEDAVQSLTDYVAGKRLVLRSFRDKKSIEEIKGIYVPFWVHDADVSARVDFTGITEERHSSGNRETVTTRYYDVVRAGTIAYDAIPADGSQKMPDDVMESIEPFDYKEAVDFNTAYLSGYLADKYDVPQEQVRPRMTERVRTSVEDTFRSTVHGYDRVVQKGSAVRFDKTNVDYALYPVWILNTVHEDKTYTFAMNGQTGKIVGNLPMDMKLFLTYFIGIALLAGLVMFGAASGVLGGISGLSIGIGFGIGIIVAAIVTLVMKGKLKTVRFQDNATQYYRPNSFVLSYKRDRYLYKDVRVIHHNDNN